MRRIDVAVVGAGVAGLAAAGELARRGHRVVVLEARERIGGRIYTCSDERVPVPIELGAEFIHGKASETLRLLKQAHLAACDVGREHWQSHRGSVRRVTYFKKIDRVLKRIGPRDRDGSFATFLKRRPGGRSEAQGRAVAQEFVEGFFAADPHRISARAVAPQGGESPSEAAAHSARVVQGYDALAWWLARQLGSRIRLRAAVTEIDWERGGAELTVRLPKDGSTRLRARTVAITVPLGVLQARPGDRGSIRLRPDPPSLRRALNSMAMGPVTRLTFWFDDFPWHLSPRLGRDGKLDRLSFLHLNAGPFKIWWTPYPLRWPLMVAWCAGPQSASLARRKQGEIEGAALQDLAVGLGVSRRRIVSKVRGLWTHDWNNDPFSRGAYAYALAGRDDSVGNLARPVDSTLFFAGEATDPEGSGTVEGALSTGLRAARQIHAVLRRD